MIEDSTVKTMSEQTKTLMETAQDIADAVVLIEKITGKIVNNLRIDEAGVFISFSPKPFVTTDQLEMLKKIREKIMEIDDNQVES